MAAYQDNRKSGDLASWIVTVVFLVTPLWPIGLIMLFRKLMGGSAKKSGQSRHPYDQRGQEGAPGTQGMGAARQTQPTGAGPARQTAQTPPPGGKQTWRSTGRGAPPPSGAASLSHGKGLTIGGAVLSILFGVALVSGLPFVAMSEGFLLALAIFSPVIGFFCGGLAMLWSGTQRTKRARRFRKYLALIGRRESISITTLAQAMPTSVRKACDDLQEMLDRGVLAAGYLDMSTGRLILSDEGLWEQSAPAPEEEQEPEGEGLDMNDADAVLTEIRTLNDAIADPELSRKIDRIGTITGKIFAYQQQNPGEDGRLRSFLGYYLPTTLKILHAYAQMEAQEVEGENIRAAKARIEGMMDKVVEGFEKQLDRLFENSAMDITTDVEVLERMLQKDGLSSGGLTLGI